MVLMDSLSNMVTWSNDETAKNRGFSLPRPTLVRQKKLGRPEWTITSWWFQPIWKIWVKLDHFPRVSGWTYKNIWVTTIQTILDHNEKKKKHPPEPSWNPHRRPYFFTPATDKGVKICWQILKCPRPEACWARNKKISQGLFVVQNYRYKWMLTNFWLLRADPLGRNHPWTIVGVYIRLHPKTRMQSPPQGSFFFILFLVQLGSFPHVGKE